jgi:hypothetical protein
MVLSECVYVLDVMLILNFGVQSPGQSSRASVLRLRVVVPMVIRLVGVCVLPPVLYMCATLAFHCEKYHNINSVTQID